jgi:hypothetical protein
MTSTATKEGSQVFTPSRKRSRSPRIGVLAILLIVVCLAVPAADHPCGDGICEGPENRSNCPQDCGSAPSDGAPNPLRAIVSRDLLGWRDWLGDGGFEQGMDAVVILEHPATQLSAASVTRTPDAARSGAFGVRIEASEGEGVRFALRAKVEKGESTRCTFWARSADQPVQLAVSVLGVEAGQAEPRPLHTPDGPFEIGTDWTKVQFTFGNTRGVEYALLALDVGPNRTLDLDDVAIEAEQWVVPSVCRLERIVGGIQVPITPAAPIHFNVLIHIEDPRLITQREGYFLQKTTVFTELARVLHEHGGFLTIQPEEDWPMASLTFAPTTLSDLSMEYGVAYSTHTHGPACIDPDGRLRSNQDCNDCRTCPGWSGIETDTDPYTPEYVGALRELISNVSGTEVSDHNGNFHYGNTAALADAGISTWSAFKDHNTQSTFDQLFTNPWRPSDCDAIETPELFQTHDPDGSVIFIPGWGQAITRHPERLHERLAAMLAQVLCHADPDRVNTFYIVTHVDHYRGEDGEPYIEVDESTGRVTLHEAFYRDLGYWEETLTELIDPLIAEGYLAWTSLPEIGQLFCEWEAQQSAP